MVVDGKVLYRGFKKGCRRNVVNTTTVDRPAFFTTIFRTKDENQNWDVSFAAVFWELYRFGTYGYLFLV